jgi:2-polyprenyl-3-methyl-5-hydroxy-6-metoxy-1,4-benzoquinol methylase
MYITNDRSKLALSLLDDFSSIKVITDLGCMDGATLSGISSFLTLNTKYYGVDYSLHSTLINSDKINFIKCDLNIELSDIKNIIKETDVLLLLDVLEHLHHPEIFLQHTIQMMKPGAKFIITVPNASSIRKLIAWLKNDFPRNEIGYFDKTHRSWFTTKSIKNLIPKDVRLEKVGFIYSKKTLIKIFQKLLPTRLASQFYIKLTKK